MDSGSGSGKGAHRWLRRRIRRARRSLPCMPRCVPPPGRGRPSSTRGAQRIRRGAPGMRRGVPRFRRGVPSAKRGRSPDKSWMTPRQSWTTPAGGWTTPRHSLGTPWDSWTTPRHSWGTPDEKGAAFQRRKWLNLTRTGVPDAQTVLPASESGRLALVAARPALSAGGWGHRPATPARLTPIPVRLASLPRRPVAAARQSGWQKLPYLELGSPQPPPSPAGILRP